MSQASSRMPMSRLLIAGGAALAAAVVANLLARLLLGLFIAFDPAFPPFSYGAISVVTIIFCLIALVVLAIVNRFTANPLRVYNIVGVAAGVVSILPNIATGMGMGAAPMGGDPGNYLTLIWFHVVAGAAFLGALNYMARRA